MTVKKHRNWNKNKEAFDTDPMQPFSADNDVLKTLRNKFVTFLQWWYKHDLVVSYVHFEQQRGRLEELRVTQLVLKVISLL